MDLENELEPSTLGTIRRRLFNFALLSHSCGFLFAAFLTVGITAFCLWIIYLDWHRNVQFSLSGWAQSIITFMLGAWITDRPKFFKTNNNKN